MDPSLENMFSLFDCRLYSYTLRPRWYLERAVSIDIMFKTITDIISNVTIMSALNLEISALTIEEHGVKQRIFS